MNHMFNPTKQAGMQKIASDQQTDKQTGLHLLCNDEMGVTRINGIRQAQVPTIKNTSFKELFVSIFEKSGFIQSAGIMFSQALEDIFIQQKRLLQYVEAFLYWWPRSNRHSRRNTILSRKVPPAPNFIIVNFPVVLSNSVDNLSLE
ncbi:hypothetical protein A7310_07900 [Bacillus velezensis]|nr:hypothetical protein A7310_07900 [Bacillus velezensis]